MHQWLSSALVLNINVDNSSNIERGLLFLFVPDVYRKRNNNLLTLYSFVFYQRSETRTNKNDSS